MAKMNWKRFLLMAGLMSVATLAASAAEAGWSRHAWGSSGGSYGSHGGSWGSGGGSWGSSGGSWGATTVYSSHGSGGSWGSSGGSWGGHRHHGVFARWRAHRAAKWGSSGGSWGSHGSHGGYVTGYSSHGSSGGSWGSSGGVYYGEAVEVHKADAPVPPGEAGDAPLPPQLPMSYRMLNDNSVTISLRVPADAQVFINDAPTSSVGAERVYVSKGLEAGRRYKYTVRAEVIRDGQTVVESRELILATGQQSQLAMNFRNAETVAEKPAAEPRKTTTLKVNVPVDAKVTVLGQESQQTGETRVFHTSKLAEGETWDGYAVRATIVRDGQELTLEKTVSLQGGASQELSFEFNDVELAALASASAR